VFLLYEQLHVLLCQCDFFLEQSSNWLHAIVMKTLNVHMYLIIRVCVFVWYSW